MKLIKQVSCPKCLAAIGEECLSRNGKHLRGTFHEVRWAKYREVQEDEDRRLRYTEDLGIERGSVYGKAGRRALPLPQAE